MLGSRHGSRRWPRLAVAAVPAFLVLPFTAVGGTGVAAAVGAAPPSFVCGAPMKPPATLVGGSYSTVEVKGACQVNGGKVTVTGDVTVDPKATLLAAFANNDVTGHGASSLNVHGNLFVGSGGTVLLGCEAAHSPCADDQGKTPTLNSPEEFIGGSLIATNALGDILHVTTVGGDVRFNGGGGGVNCKPTGVFAQFQSPVFSDIEDNIIGGNVWATGMQSCWLGTLRNQVGGSITFAHNTMADPDAMEILTNNVRGNIVCVGNSPANQYGDSHGMPNIIGGFGAGQCAFSVKVPDPSPGGPLTPIAVPAVHSPGYDLGGADGGLFTFGPAFFGSAAGTEPGPYVGPSTAPGGLGYYLGDAIGILQMYGPNAKFFGDPNGLPLNKPIEATAAAPGGDGYWEAGGDGGVFGFGPGAPFEGSAGAVHLAKPIVGIVAAPTGDGYDLVASDGGVFTFGPGAHFHGSLGNVHLNAPIVGMAIDPSTGGYWLVGSDGGVFTFHAPFLGSLGATHLNSPIVGMAAAPTGNGYYLVGRDGGVFTFGTGAHYHGSLGNVHLNAPITGIALG